MVYRMCLAWAWDLSWLIMSAGRRSEVAAMGCGSTHVPCSHLPEKQPDWRGQGTQAAASQKYQIMISGICWDRMS